MKIKRNPAAKAWKLTPEGKRPFAVPDLWRFGITLEDLDLFIRSFPGGDRWDPNVTKGGIAGAFGIHRATLFRWLANPYSDQELPEPFASTLLATSVLPVPILKTIVRPLLERKAYVNGVLRYQSAVFYQLERLRLEYEGLYNFENIKHLYHKGPGIWDRDAPGVPPREPDPDTFPLIPIWIRHPPFGFDVIPYIQERWGDLGVERIAEYAPKVAAARQFEPARLAQVAEGPARKPRGRQVPYTEDE